MRLNLPGKFLLFILLILFSVCKADTVDKQRKIQLRTIGHEFLLELNDSTSRVLPIKKQGERFLVQFQRKFAFEPEKLTSLVYNVLLKNNSKDHFLVEIEECGSSKVVHSFEASPSKNENTIACKTRGLPEACYKFYFTLVPLAGTATQTESIKAENWNYLLLLLVVLLAGGVAVYFIKNKQNREQGKISIGQFLFDQKNMTLYLKAQSIELSAKESDLLFLLFTHENKTLERAYILNQIWGDEGDYVGRTLDVFISKLRKKVAADPNLKIINIRGVGYRFTVN